MEIINMKHRNVVVTVLYKISLWFYHHKRNNKLIAKILKPSLLLYLQGGLVIIDIQLKKSNQSLVCSKYNM